MNRHLVVVTIGVALAVAGCSQTTDSATSSQEGGAATSRYPTAEASAAVDPERPDDSPDPSLSIPVYPEVEPSADAPTWFEAPPVSEAPDLEPCAADDLANLPADGFATGLQKPQRFSVLFAINLSADTCRLGDLGMAGPSGGLPSGSLLELEQGDVSLAPGEVATFGVSWFAPDPWDRDAIGQIRLHVAGEPVEPVLWWADGVFADPGDARWVGPIRAPEPVRLPEVVVPSTPGAGDPVTPSASVSIHGVGALRFGDSLRDVADATGQVIVVTEWNLAADGCGYAWHASGIDLILSADTGQLADATVAGASFRTEAWRTVSGLGVGTTADEVRAALGADRVRSIVNEYGGHDDLRFTPEEPDDAHHGVFFRMDHDDPTTVDSFEAGGEIGRLEGCA